MMKWGVLDFAGGDVVHISSGTSGLVAAFIVGKRRSFGQGAELPPHNLMLTFIGGSLLWVGWFGFNAGSALTAGTSASMAMLVTHIAASSAALTWMFTEWLVSGKPTVLGIVTGAVVGLVVITPGAGYVDQTGAFVMGIIGAWGCYLGIKLKHVLGYDDALDAFGVHGVGGILGGGMTGLFANPHIAEGIAGGFYFNGPQLGWQIAGILVTMLYSAGMTALILVILKFTMGLRVSSEDEDLGLDISEHGHAHEPDPKPFPSAAPSMPMVITPYGLQPALGFPAPFPYRP
jgi:Amt family ammonium transporter